MGRTRGPPKQAKLDKKKTKNGADGDESPEKDKGGGRTQAGAGCVDCGKAVLSTQTGIKCDACDFWHHCECEGVEDEVYAFLVEHDKETSLQWYCKKCVATCGKMKAMMMSMHEHQQRLEERVEEMSKTMGGKIVELAAMVSNLANGDGAGIKDKQQREQQKRVEEKVDALATVVKGQQKADDMQLHECMQRAISRQRQEEADEIEEVRKRRSNVIIHGLKEPEALDAADRKAQDEDLILSLLHNINCDTLSVNSLVRLGKKPEEAGTSKPRPIMLTLASEEQKDKILSRAKNLRRIKEMERVFIHQDQTPKQRMKRQELLKELKDREQKGEKNLIIISGKIVVRRQRGDATGNSSETAAREEQTSDSTSSTAMQTA